MSDDLLVTHCSPTLACLKTGSLFLCPYEDRECMNADLRRLNRLFQKKGLRILPLRYDGNKALLYLYRPNRLQTDLLNQDAVRLLRNLGYQETNMNACIVKLISRINSEKDFPHEVGLFLGYPPEDVSGFMNHPECPKAVGCWKVYGNVEAAEKLFSRYKKCTCIYKNLYQNGRSLEKLSVAG